MSAILEWPTAASIQPGTDCGGLVSVFESIVGKKHVLTDESATLRYRAGFRFGIGKALAVVRPGSLVEQWRVLKACINANVIVISQASNTGLTGGSTPDGDDYDRDIVIVSTTRMKKVYLIITGGARGMGASHARGFVAEGANVVIADVLEQEGRMLADELGDRAIFSRLDVTSDTDWATTVTAAEEAFGPVSVLVNNAGIVRFGLIAETEPADWRRVLDINLTGSYLGIRAVVPSMRKAGRGAIVNISSGAGMTGSFGVGAYVASKWGVRGMTKTAALELARDNIRVNSIHPGNVLTPMLGGSDAAAVGAGAVRNLAIPRIAAPEELTRMVLFVASDEASFSTGSEFIADGGHLLGPVPG